MASNEALEWPFDIEMTTQFWLGRRTKVVAPVEGSRFGTSLYCELPPLLRFR